MKIGIIIKILNTIFDLGWIVLLIIGAFELSTFSTRLMSQESTISFWIGGIGLGLSWVVFAWAAYRLVKYLIKLTIDLFF